MKNIGEINYPENKTIPYFCNKISSLLSDKPTCDLIFALEEPADQATQQENRRLLLFAQIASRRHHNLQAAFPPTLFRDANWAIMLTCFTALLEGRTQCVKEIQLLLDDSHTAVLRHIDALEAHQLIGRQRDPIDGRRTLVLLSGFGATAVAKYLNSFHQALGEGILRQDRSVN